MEQSKTLIWPFRKKNYILLAISLIVITIGYICLGWGEDPDNPISLTLAPIVLIIGYGLIPFAIMAKSPEKAVSDSENETEDEGN